MHDAARQQEQKKQHRERVEETGPAEHVEGEASEDRLHLDSLQAVGAAGDIRKAFRQRFQQQRDAERHHQPRQIDAADHQETGEEAERHRDKAGHDQREHRLGDDAVQRQQAGSIGADAEERGVPERDDAGVTQDQVKRQCEQRQPHDVGHDEIARWKDERAGQHNNPERGLAPVPASVLDGMVSDVGLCGHGTLNAWRCGRTGRSDARSGSRSSGHRSRTAPFSERNICRRHRRCQAGAPPERAP